MDFPDVIAVRFLPLALSSYDFFRMVRPIARCPFGVLFTCQDGIEARLFLHREIALPIDRDVDAQQGLPVNSLPSHQRSRDPSNAT